MAGYLQTCDCFRDVSSKFKDLGSVFTFPPNAEVYHQGSPCDTVYLIEHGIVKLCHTDNRGRQIIAALRRPHWLLGIPPAILEVPHAVSAVTLGRCTLRSISAKNLLNLADFDHELSCFIRCILSREVYSQIEKTAHLGCMSAEERLEHFLSDLISSQDPEAIRGQMELVIPVRYVELAQILAVTPEHLSRVLAKMESDGCIRRRRGALILTDPAALIRKTTPESSSLGSSP